VVIVKARVVVKGFRKSVEEVALVDTGSTYTLIDRVFAREIGVKTVDRRVNLIVADGHEVIGDLAVINELMVENESLPYAHIVILDFPNKLAKRLEDLGLSKHIILGLLTLETLGLAPDTATGRLKKVGALFLIKLSK